MSANSELIFIYKLTRRQKQLLARVKSVLRDIADNGECDDETKAALEMCATDVTLAALSDVEAAAMLTQPRIQ